MPKDEWGNARAREMARHAAREYAIDGYFRSYERVQDDLYPTDLTVKANSSRRRSGSAGPNGGQVTSRSPSVKAKRSGSKGRAVTIANVFVPASLADVAVGMKYTEGGRWILTSKRGCVIAKFPTEGDLDRWWAAFQKSRGRAPRALRLGRAPIREQERSARHLPEKNASLNCVCNPAWLV
jgi:hypothetical protein